MNQSLKGLDMEEFAERRRKLSRAENGKDLMCLMDILGKDAEYSGMTDVDIVAIVLSASERRLLAGARAYAKRLQTEPRTRSAPASGFKSRAIWPPDQ